MDSNAPGIYINDCLSHQKSPEVRRLVIDTTQSDPAGEHLYVFVRGDVYGYTRKEGKCRRPSYSSIKLLEYNILSCIPGLNSYNQGLGRIKYSGENRKIKSIRFYNRIILIRSLVYREENINDGEETTKWENPPPYIDSRLPY